MTQGRQAVRKATPSDVCVKPWGGDEPHGHLGKDTHSRGDSKDRVSEARLQMPGAFEGQWEAVRLALAEMGQGTWVCVMRSEKWQGRGLRGTQALPGAGGLCS